MPKWEPTGHAGFDAESRGQHIGTGNVISNVQTSSFIRPRTETECNGRTFPEGELRRSDMATFRSGNGLPKDIEDAVLRATETEQAILYRFQHHDGERRIVHGFVLTRGDSECSEMVWARTTGPTNKSDRIIQAMVSAISNPAGTSARVAGEIIPAAVEMGSSVFRGLDGEVADAVSAIADQISLQADGGRHGDLWRAWMAVAEDRPLPEFICPQIPGSREAVEDCRAALDTLDADTARVVRQAMKSLADAAMQAGGDLVNPIAIRLRAADAIIASVRDREPMPVAGPGMG